MTRMICPFFTAKVFPVLLLITDSLITFTLSSCLDCIEDRKLLIERTKSKVEFLRIHPNRASLTEHYAARINKERKVLEIYVEWISHL